MKFPLNKVKKLLKDSVESGVHSSVKSDGCFLVSQSRKHEDNGRRLQGSEISNKDKEFNSSNVNMTGLEGEHLLKDIYSNDSIS